MAGKYFKTWVESRTLRIAGLTLWYLAAGFVIGSSSGCIMASYPGMPPKEWQLKNPPEWALVESSEEMDIYIGTKTVSIEEGETTTAVIKFVPKDTEAGRKEKQKTIDRLAPYAGEAKANLYSFELDTAEFQCGKNTYLVRTYAIYDAQGNHVYTSHAEAGATPREPGLSTPAVAILEAACYLSRELKSAPRR